MATFDIFHYDEDGFIVYSPYSPENIIAGDTDSSYVCLDSVFEKDADPDKVIEFADWVGETVNDSFTQFMLDLFNSPGNRSNVVQTDREAVSDKSYFMAKKKYIMHVINSEGVPCDELKNTGTEIKKSDTPPIIQKFLSDLVDMIMNDKTFEEIRKFYMNFKESYQEKDIYTIAIPKTLKTFKNYNDMYQSTRSMDGFPYHVRAAIYYNENCGKNNKRLKAGDKIKICYIKHPSYPYMAMPAEEHDIAEFVYDLTIDQKTMWAKVMDKIEIYLTPIGLDKTSRKKTRINSLMKF